MQQSFCSYFSLAICSSYAATSAENGWITASAIAILVYSIVIDSHTGDMPEIYDQYCVRIGTVTKWRGEFKNPMNGHSFAHSRSHMKGLAESQRDACGKITERWKLLVYAWMIFLFYGKKKLIQNHKWVWIHFRFTSLSAQTMDKL